MISRSCAIILILLSFTESARANEAVPCHLLTPHDAKSGAAYVPGINIQGEPVTPADINDMVTAVPNVVTIPVTIDFVEAIGQDLPDGTILEGAVARVEIYNDGRVMYNGQDISGQIEAACALVKKSNNSLSVSD